MKVFILFLKYIYSLFYRDKKYSKRYFSQNGEDVFASNLFSCNYKGFYIDVGCHHPYRFSNTYLFYLNGWHGINIDATPGVKKKFDKERPKDINLELGISDTIGELDFYIFNYAHTAVNTFSKKQATQFVEKGEQVIEVRKIQVTTLAEICLKYLPVGQQIDILTVDVEGFDLNVLKSNDWKNNMPKVIIVEEQNTVIANCHDSEIYKYLCSFGYVLCTIIQNTLIFKLNDKI